MFKEKSKEKKFKLIYLLYIFIIFGSLFYGLLAVPWALFVIVCLNEFVFSYLERDFVVCISTIILAILSVIFVLYNGPFEIDFGCGSSTVSCSNAICPNNCISEICDCYGIDEKGREQIIQCSNNFYEQ